MLGSDRSATAAAERKDRLRDRFARTAVGKKLAPLMRVFARARELVPLTNLGLALLAFAVLAYWKFALPRADYVVRLVAGLTILLLLAALLSVLAGAIAVHRSHKRITAGGSSRHPAAISFEARRGFLSLLKMPSWRFIPLIEISWVWERPEGFTVSLANVEGELMENVDSTSRSVTKEIVRRFTIEDGFGLARAVLRRREERSIRVLPWTGELAHAPLLRALSGGDDVPHPYGQLTGDRVDMRRYVPGDPLRLALWKVYARTGELMVRTQERAIAPAVRIIAYLPAASGDEPPAAAARVAIEGGLLGDGWTFSADGANQPATDVEGALAVISESRAARGTEKGDAAGLAAFLESTASQAPVRIILFVPATPGPWVERASAAIKKYGAAVTVVIVTDGVREEDKEGSRKMFDRLLRIPDAPDPDADAYTSHEKIAEVARSLAGLGTAAQVVAVERPTGRALALGLRGQPAQLGNVGGTPRRVA